MAETGAAAYRLNAVRCIEIAKELPGSKVAFLTMARAWITLADQAEKNSQLPPMVHETSEPRQSVAQQQQQPQRDKK